MAECSYRSSVVHGLTNAAAAWHWLRPVLDDGGHAPILDESFVQGVPRAESATYHCFVYDAVYLCHETKCVRSLIKL